MVNPCFPSQPGPLCLVMTFRRPSGNCAILDNLSIIPRRLWDDLTEGCNAVIVKWKVIYRSLLDKEIPAISRKIVSTPLKVWGNHQISGGHLAVVPVIVQSCQDFQENQTPERTPWLKLGLIWATFLQPGDSGEFLKLMPQISCSDTASCTKKYRRGMPSSASSDKHIYRHQPDG